MGSDPYRADIGLWMDSIRRRMVVVVMKEEIKEKYADRDDFWYEERIPDEINGWIYKGSLGVADTHGFMDDMDKPNLVVGVKEISRSGYKVELVDMSDKSTLKEMAKHHGGYTKKEGLTARKVKVLKDVPNYERRMYFWICVNRAIEWMKENSPEEVLEE